MAIMFTLYCLFILQMCLLDYVITYEAVKQLMKDLSKKDEGHKDNNELDKFCS